ncbi:MAG: NAD(P)/FAD-dependent oxidoreductase [Methanolinea sp.]|nr:NAD(P)/FAD-dependent oxidoreductase [Methanolinea sp.]
MKVCIIGGGLTGLTAALSLGKEHEVDLYEKRHRLGGCLASYEVGDTHVESFYHHCFSGDNRFFSLLGTLGLRDRLEWFSGSTGYFAGGKVYPLTTPGQILSYPYLTLWEKARLALLTLRSRSIDAASLDGVTAREFIVGALGERTYESFFEPLLASKFGDYRDRISAAWLVSRIAIRSHRGLSGERLGYLKGGFHAVISALAERVGRDCTIRLGDPVEKLAREAGGWRVNDRRYDAVISTVPPQALPPMSVPDVEPVPYQGAACVLAGLGRDPAGGVYWLNMKDPAPYGAVIVHTNLVPRERYGEHLVYLASYFHGKLPEKADERMLSDFCTRFGIPRGEIHWHRFAVEQYAGPLYVTGYAEKILPYRAAGLYFAGMFSRPNYPERSMEGAVAAGTEVAELVGREAG